MTSIFTQIRDALGRGERGALATIVKRKGSVPRREGAHFFLTSTGELHGTIGGGGLEAEVLELARDSIRSGVGFLRSFTLVEGDDPSDMVCGGNVTVLVEPVRPEAAPVYEAVAEALANHEACCFLRLFQHEPQKAPRVVPGPTGVIKGGGASLFTAPLEAGFKNRLLSWGEVLLKEGDATVRALDAETLNPPASGPWTWAVAETLQAFPRLVIFGGGHLSRALCAMASLCRFRVEVIDDREEFANKARFPEASRVFHLPGYRKIPELVGLDSHTYVVIATRGHRFDEVVLGQVVDFELPYIGMVGSRQKNAIVFERLRESGVPPEKLEGVRAPIGLSIHSETPEEIAVSILAELIQTRGSRKRKT